MKNSHLVKLLVIAFALQGSQLMSLPALKQTDGSDSYTSLKEALDEAGTDKQARKIIINKLLAYYDEDTRVNNVLSLKFVESMNFNIPALRAEIEVRDSLSTRAINIARLAKNYAKDGLEALKTDRKAQIKAALTALALISVVIAYRNRATVRAGFSKAFNLATDNRVAKWVGDKAMNNRVATFVKGKYNSLPGLPALPSTESVKAKAKSLRTAISSKLPSVSMPERLASAVKFVKSKVGSKAPTAAVAAASAITSAATAETPAVVNSSLTDRLDDINETMSA